MAVPAAAKATASNSLQAMREAKDASDVDETSDPGRIIPKKYHWIQRTKTMPLKWHRKHTKSLCFRSSLMKPSFGYQLRPGFSEIFSSVKLWTKARKCKSWMKNFASIAGNIGLAWTVYRSFVVVFFSPPQKVTLFGNLSYSWIMQKIKSHTRRKCFVCDDLDAV